MRWIACCYWPFWPISGLQARNTSNKMQRGSSVCRFCLRCALLLFLLAFYFQDRIFLTSNSLCLNSLVTDILSPVCHSIFFTFILQCVTLVYLLYAVHNTQGLSGFASLYCYRRGKKERENVLYELLNLNKMYSKYINGHICIKYQRNCHFLSSQFTFSFGSVCLLYL